MVGPSRRRCSSGPFGESIEWREREHDTTSKGDGTFEAKESFERRETPTVSRCRPTLTLTG